MGGQRGIYKEKTNLFKHIKTQLVMSYYRFTPKQAGHGFIGHIHEDDRLIALVYAKVFYMANTEQPVNTRLIDFVKYCQDNPDKAVDELQPITDLLRDLFITAWEGGSNYWAEVREQFNAETTFKFMLKGDSLTVYDRESTDKWTITIDDLFDGLDKLKDQYPDHYKNIGNESWDAETADVWFQLAVIGKLTFG